MYKKNSNEMSYKAFEYIVQDGVFVWRENLAFFVAKLVADETASDRINIGDVQLDGGMIGRKDGAR